MTKLLLYECKKTPLVFLLLSSLLMLIFKGGIAGAYFNEYDKEWRQLYSNYLAYTLEHDDQTAEQELREAREKLAQSSTEVVVIDKVLEQLENREYYAFVQDVAQVESGYVFNMPPDFNKLRSVYASYHIPDMVNVLGYQLFVKLNEVNFIPIIIILAFSSLFSIERDTGMQSIIRATGMGWSNIFRSKLVLAVGTGTLLFNLGYIFDLSLTIALSDFDFVSRPYRSVISSVLTNDSISLFLTKYYIIGILNTVFMSCLVLLLSSISKNSKLAFAINGFAFVAFTIVGTTIDTLDKAATLVTGNLMKLYTETSLLIIPNSSIVIEQYTVIMLLYITAIPFLLYALRKTS